MGGLLIVLAGVSILFGVVLTLTGIASSASYVLTRVSKSSKVLAGPAKAIKLIVSLVSSVLMVILIALGIVMIYLIGGIAYAIK